MGDETELGGQHYLVAAALECPADEFLVDVRAVDLGGVDQGHAEIERPVDGADRFGVVAAGAGVAVGHAHCAQADAGDGQVAESSRVFMCDPFVVRVVSSFWRRLGGPNRLGY